MTQRAKDEDGLIKTVWIYVDTSKQIGDRTHLRVFVTEDAAEKWLTENDPEGVAFLYEVEGTSDDEMPLDLQRG